MKFGRLQNGLIRAQQETAPSNFILNPSPVKDTTGWATYADAAGTAPVDGTGGSPTVTWTRTTSSPLSESASFLFTKDAANRQGNGVSYDFTVNSADKAKKHTINFDYEVASGTYADGDLTVWIYDVTNGGSPIQPSASSILNGIGPQQKQTLSFQTNSNSTSYRLIIHCASTSAVAYTVKFDNFQVSRQSTVYGNYAGYLGQLTTTGSWTTNTTYTAHYWRTAEGKLKAEVTVSLSGAPNAAQLTVNVPNSLQMDIGLMSEASQLIGNGQDVDSGVGRFQVQVIYESSTQVGLYYGSDTGSGALRLVSGGITQAAPQTFASGDRISFRYEVPIVGWASPQLLSSEADTRVVAASYGMSASSTSTSITASDTLLDFDTKIEDSHGAVTTGASWKYTAPIPGLYKIRYSVTGTGLTGDLAIIGSVYRNGTKYREQYREKGNTTSSRVPDFTFEFLVPLKAGEYFAPYIYSSTSNTIQKSITYNWIDIEKISGPAQIADNEQVFAKATSSTTTVGTSATVIINPTVVKNTHGAYNSSTGQFTCPTAGDYEIVVGWNSGSAVSSSSIGSGVLGYTRKNTSLVSLISEFMYQQNTTSIFPHNYAKGTVPNCVAGDVIDFTLQRSASISSFALDGNAQDCWIEFRRIK